MGFEFRRRNAVEISGERYEVDFSDVGFIEAAITGFGGMIQEYNAIRALEVRRGDSPDWTPGSEEMTKMARGSTEGAQRVISLAHKFIEQALGAGVYDEIFAELTPNLMEHIRLCTYIYEMAVDSREGVVRRYVLPDAVAPRTGFTDRSPRGGSEGGFD